MRIPLCIKKTFINRKYKETAERQATNSAQTDTRGGYRDIMYSYNITIILGTFDRGELQLSANNVIAAV